ncbi:MAG: hypothetical protein A3J59_02615 [Candidatus Buchananbacteria bacterium RIFCSPHIGHO2_02_FULL_56_16]|uniref:Phosphoenolpyruvate synthase n=1 Tax=Candidatus Buchananbacteria bacterium RIFCSPHIGHO2_02_FULL_56_16 TaxID=1797542 RepID=A0A1G1YG60_9BACT|nr:MAG: hypothetical protein A3J59_02615 [Candidatus Buchananbacteria bacterium RIFCSPHIGHO2_02_FULL_56_16]
MIFNNQKPRVKIKRQGVILMDQKIWTVTNERQGASPLLGFIPLFSSMARDIVRYLSEEFELEFLVEFSSGHVRMATVVSEWEKAGTLTVHQLRSSDFIDWIVDGLTIEMKNLNQLGTTLRSADFSGLSGEELAVEFTRAIDALKKFILYNNFVNTADFYHGILTTAILELLRTSIHQGAAITPEVAYSSLTTPEKLVWIQEEDMELLEILALVQADPELVSVVRSDPSGESLQRFNHDVRLALKRHAQRYFWIRYEQEGETLTFLHFHSKLVQMLDEKINATKALLEACARRTRVKVQYDSARSSVTLDNEAEHLLAVARRLVYWKLHLREVKIRFYCCADNLMHEIARRLGLNHQQVRHLTEAELTGALCSSIQLKASALERRVAYCVFHFTAEQTLLFEGQRARDEFSVVQEEAIVASINEVSGTCAHPGVVEGSVMQVLKAEDGDNFRRGNILVAYMTDISVVPAMRRASAIVTDVGGVTCHASIIAREFGIPCVIGTRIATKVLRNGYTVKVNADAGLVTILSREDEQAEMAQAGLVEDTKQQLTLNFEIPATRTIPASSEIVRDITHLTLSDVRIAGGKGASLGEMVRFDLPVPPGYVILTSAFEEFVFGSALGLQINELLRGVCDQQSLRRNSRAIQELIIRSEIPPGIAEKIVAAFVRLSSAHVAVRSSAALEDSVDASWAGQLDSFLNTISDDLLLNVKKCWASIFSDRAISYRAHIGLSSGTLATAVVIQRMLESRISGTAFSVHPVTGNDRSVFIESCVGLGETLVLGRYTPTSYLVEKDTLKVSKSLSQQETGLRRAKHGKGNELFTIPQADGEKNSLTDDEIREVALLVIDIEEQFGFLVDVEWAYEKNKLYVLQSRPVTVLGERDKAS